MSQGLVIRFSPKGDNTKIFTRIFTTDGFVFFPNQHAYGTDAEAIANAAAIYQREYSAAVKNIGTVHKVAAVEIPDDLLVIAAAFVTASTNYQQAVGSARSQAAIALTTAFADLNERIRILEKNISEA